MKINTKISTKPKLICLAGPTGAGKTTIGQALCERMAIALKWPVILLDDDVARRKIVGKDMGAPFELFDYREDVSRQVVAVMDASMMDHLRRGAHVINVSGYWSPQSRAYAEGVAQRAGCDFYGLWLTAPRDVLQQRISERSEKRSKNIENPSDGTLTDMDKFGDMGEVTWPVIKTDKDMDAILREIFKKIGLPPFTNHAK